MDGEEPGPCRACRALQDNILVNELHRQSLGVPGQEALGQGDSFLNPRYLEPLHVHHGWEPLGGSRARDGLSPHFSSQEAPATGPSRLQSSWMLMAFPDHLLRKSVWPLVRVVLVSVLHTPQQGKGWQC